MAHAGRQAYVAEAHAPPPHDCFEPVLAECPTRTVPINAVVDLLAAPHRPECIAEYRLAMEHGDRFPPIAVVRLGRWYLIADGHKRFSAYTALPVTDIVVEVWPLRRWLRDQSTQFTGKTRQQCRLIWRSLFDPETRPLAVRLFWDTVGHWQRVGISIIRFVGRRR